MYRINEYVHLNKMDLNTSVQEYNENNNVIRCHVTRITECNVITILVITRNTINPEIQ